MSDCYSERKDASVLADLDQRRERLKELQLEWEQLKKSAVSTTFCAVYSLIYQTNV